MQEYLPEWKIYLWKKLLLNREGFDKGTVSVHAFMFFSNEEQNRLMHAKNQRMIGSAQQTYGLAAARRAAVQIDAAGQQSVDDDYYSCHPINILAALIELMGSKPRVLSITAKLDKRYITWYRQEKRKYEAMQQRKHLASLGMSRGSAPYKPNDGYMNDPFCGLGEVVYKKAETGESLTVDEFRRLANFSNHTTHDFLVLKLKINKPALQAKLDAYIDDFLAGNLVGPYGSSYYAAHIQRLNIYGYYIQPTTGEYGHKMRQLTIEKIATYLKWPPGEEKKYRFFETLLSLERTGNIVVNDVRQSEVIISLVTENDAPTATAATQVTPASGKTYTSVLSLNPILDLSPEIQSKTGRFLDTLQNRIEMKAGAVTHSMSVSISKRALEMDGIAVDEAENFIAIFNRAITPRLEKPKDEEVANKKGLYSLPLLDVLPALQFPLFELNDTGKENLEIGVGYPPIVGEIRKRLPQPAAKPSTKELSAADKKRLFILERLKEEWDLAPKQNSGPTMLQAGLVVYQHHAGEIDVPWYRFSAWLEQCGIDFYQLQNILTTFQQEELLESFSVHSEYE